MHQKNETMRPVKFNKNFARLMVFEGLFTTPIIVSSNMLNYVLTCLFVQVWIHSSEIQSELKLFSHVGDKTKPCTFSITGRSYQISQNTWIGSMQQTMYANSTLMQLAELSILMMWDSKWMLSSGEKSIIDTTHQKRFVNLLTRPMDEHLPNEWSFWITRKQGELLNVVNYHIFQTEKA